MTVSPVSVVTVHRPAASSNVAAVTRVLNVDVAAQVEPLGDVLQVGEDLVLLGVTLAPRPLLHEPRSKE